MFDTDIYVARRKGLAARLEKGIALFPGNGEVGMNYSANSYHFRQDSNFLYYFGIDRPDLVALADLDEGTSWLFGDDASIEDIVWTGPQPSIAEWAARAGIEHTAPLADLEGFLAKARQADRPIHFLPPYRAETVVSLHQWLGIPLAEVKGRASVPLVRAVVDQRAHKGPEEVAEMERALAITGQMHLAVMRAARAGMKEALLAGMARGIAIAAQGEIAYPVILTTQGQILHNHHHHRTLKEGQLVLGDFGAETWRHYAGDITRTFPVSARFDARQRDIYQIVLDAEVQAIQRVQPGVPYRDVHLFAARIIARGLKDLGLMQGDVDEAVAAGAHALFFPHGLGHMIGLDVHDMEGLGEDYVGYDDEIRRSEQFGTAYLRLGRRLEPGFVLTVEPGIYFIPELVELWGKDRRHEAFINYAEVEKWLDFTGVRIEDNVLVTETGHRVLGSPIPKTIEEVEALRAEASGK